MHVCKKDPTRECEEIKMAAVRRGAEGRNKGEKELFEGVHAWIVDVIPDEYLKLSFLISTNGGTAYERLTAKCTHCIIPAAEGKCYSLAIEQGLIIASLYWVLDTFRIVPSTLPPPHIYHPSILRTRESNSLVREKDRLLMQAVAERDNAACTYIECVPISSSNTIHTDKDGISAQLGSISSTVPRCEQWEQNMRELEHRNQELIGILEKEQQRSEQLNLELKECQLCVTQLKMNFGKQLTELQAIQQEISALEEQLQIQLRAICILKEEKNELATSLIKCEQATFQKAEEVEKVQVCNEVLQSHIHDLQGAISAIINRNQQLENVVLDQSELLERLTVENFKITNGDAEVEEEMAVLGQSYNIRSKEVDELQHFVRERQSPLDSVQLRVQQTSYPDTLDIEKQLAQQLMLPQSTLQQQLIPLLEQHTRQSVFSACELVQWSNVYRAECMSVQRVATSVSGQKGPVRAMQICKHVFSVGKLSVLTSSRRRRFLRHKCRFRHNECRPAALVRAWRRRFIPVEQLQRIATRMVVS